MDALLVLPTLNEEKALPEIASRVPEGVDVLVCDSGSEDATVDVARSLGWKVVPARHGRGQGSGLRTGFELFLSTGCSRLVIMDADNTDDPSDMPAVLDALDGGLDVVFAVRDMAEQERILGAPTVRLKRLLMGMTRFLTGYSLRDTLTGYRGFSRHAAERMLPHLRENGFGWCFEQIYVARALGMRVGEADVGFRRRIGSTKFTPFRRLEMVGIGLRYSLAILARSASGIF